MMLALSSRIVARGLRFKVAVLVIAKSLLISRDLCHVGSMVVFRRLWITLLGITAADAGLESIAPYLDIKEMRQDQVEIGRDQIRWIKELTRKTRPRNDITLFVSLLGIHSQFPRQSCRCLVEKGRLGGFSGLCDKFL
tara:strand:+ start:185 stop:598 length:414 start_codon:yes stop_codon:yes gene_type:complete